MNTKYLEKIEYEVVKEKLETYCKTYVGKEICKSLEPYSKQKDVEKALKQTSDAVLLLYKKGMAPIAEIANVELHIKRLENGDFLTAKQLLDLAHILKMAREIKAYFSNVDENNVKDNVDLSSFSYLYDMFQHLYINKDVEQKILINILDENTIADTASTKLNKIRKDKRVKESQIKEKLNSFLHTKYVQEPVITLREGRFVVPIKNEYRSVVKGFIHDISSSNQTVFIEPISVFEINNEITELQIEESIEIERILQEYSAMFFDLVEDLKNNINIIGLLDFIFAKAKYSKDFDMIEPIINNNKKIELLNAWHPLIDINKVVKNDFVVGEGYTSLVITGPNTGGKTVALKTIGLLCAMALSGMHIPAKENSTICIFDNIYADIGDEQSILNDLSTFSSHMKNIAGIINSVTENSLVLLDELGSGTDPIEGANLAISILEDLNKRGAITIATTHYPQIKQFVLVTDGFENASVEFDIETLSPTYKLLIGVPGTSNAFEISKKLGIPEYLVNNAKSMMTENQVSIENVLKEIYDDKRFIEEQKESIIEQKKQIDELEKNSKNQNNNIKEKEREILEKAKQEARELLIEAKEEASSMLKELEKSGSSKEFNNIRNSINDKINKLKSQKVKPKIENKLKKEEAKCGVQVYIPSINQTGTIIQEPNKDDIVVVQVGIIKMNFSIKELEKSDEVIKKNNKKYDYSKEHKVNIKAVSSEINVIGQTVEEARIEVDKFLDIAASSGLNECRIVHGKGTGALRQGLHKFLKNHPHVKSYRTGLYGEGENGVTIVELK
jgi:DNA mismatch repair protein MutS2